jgi:hypothetical protein
MANYRKTRILKRELGELDQSEKDYLENLANSLLEIQNVDLPQKPEGQESESNEKNEH